MAAATTNVIVTSQTGQWLTSDSPKGDDSNIPASFGQIIREGKRATRRRAPNGSL
jgi:hypothetical protein